MPQLITATIPTPQEFQDLFGFDEPSGLFNNPQFRLVINKFGRCYWLLSVDNLQGPRFSGINVYYQGNNARLIRTIYPQARRIIDVGANVGNNTIAYAEWAKNVEAFEPTPTTIKLLEANISIAKLSKLKGTYWKGNSYTGSISRDENQESGWYKIRGVPQPMDIIGTIFVQKYALSDQNGGNIWIQDHRGHGGHNFALEDPSLSKKPNDLVKVERRTLDSFPQFKNVDVIKIDVEGHEWQVLQGSKNLIKYQRPSVQVEIVRKQCARYRYSPEKIYKFFKDLDYVCVCSVRKPANQQQKELGLFFGKELEMTHRDIPKYMDRLFVPREIFKKTDFSVMDKPIEEKKAA